MTTIRRLACAVILQAVKDSANGDAEAAAWLAGEDAAGWFALAELEQNPAALAILAGRSWEEIQSRGREVISQGSDVIRIRRDLLPWVAAVLVTVYRQVIRLAAVMGG